MYVGWGNSVGRATALGAGRSGHRIPVGARFYAPVQTGPWAHLATYTMGTGSFLGGKAAGAWCWPPTPYSAEVKERVELYLYFTSGSSWLVIGSILPLHYLIYIIYYKFKICLSIDCHFKYNLLQNTKSSQFLTMKFFQTKRKPDFLICGLRVCSLYEHKDVLLTEILKDLKNNYVRC